METITFLHFHIIINPDETATDTNSLNAAIFKEKCVPRDSGRLITALWETQIKDIIILL